MNDTTRRYTDQEALDFHARGKPGKIEIAATKPMATQRDLSLAYSPGVAVPVRRIAAEPLCVYDYTAKGNLVAVVSNGTAILGLGDLGPLAAKPVMEGKAVLFKRFADVDAMDIEVNTTEVEQFVNCVRYLAPTFGGINLEDIKAPECFIIEQKLKELMDIPVFHDDQHGTAIITAAGLLNALDLTGRDIKKTRLVVNGAGAAGIACLELIKAMGLPHQNAILCDTKGVIYKGRSEGMNQWKSAHAAETKARTLEEALKGADVFLGLSAKGAMTQAMVKAMAPQPIIFACANPDPEILPEEVHAVRPDAIVATGRSDYPNQVNNVLGFPYIFRGALDVRARTINEEMKIAASRALAELAREDVPDEVAAAYSGARPSYGPNYIIPVPFDPRLIERVSAAVAEAAMKTGVARRTIADLGEYRQTLAAKFNPVASIFHMVSEHVRHNPKRMVFAEGEEEAVVRAAIAYQNSGLGRAVLVGDPRRIHAVLEEVADESGNTFDIQYAPESPLTAKYADALYGRLQRRGFIQRDCLRLVNFDRNVFAASMVAAGDADAMVTGVTRNYPVALEAVRKVLEPKPGRRVIGVSIVLAKGRVVFVADTNVHELPEPHELADIATMTAGVARRFGFEPKVALLAYSTFGLPRSERSQRVIDAVAELDRRKVDFEYDGEMAADVALDPGLLALYPFCRLKGPANVLIMPAIHAASVSTKLLAQLGGCTVIGPLLVGLEKSVQIVPIGARMTDILHMAAAAAYGISA